MSGESDQKDKNESRKIAIALVSLVLLLAVAVLWMLPILSGMVAVHLSPGVGLKDSAVISFFVTLVIMLLFAIASGDGVLGEIEFILGAFFIFFLILWLLIAWIF